MTVRGAHWLIEAYNKGLKAYGAHASLNHLSLENHS